MIPAVQGAVTDKRAPREAVEEVAVVAPAPPKGVVQLHRVLAPRPTASSRPPELRPTDSPDAPKARSWPIVAVGRAGPAASSTARRFHYR
jgi:hypothetical protein